MKKRYKVVIIEPAPVIVTGLRELVASDSEYEVAFVFSSLSECIGKLAHIAPDVVLVSPSVFEYNKRVSPQLYLSTPDSTAIVAIHSCYLDPDSLKQYDAVVELFDSAVSIKQKIRRAIDSKTSDDESVDNYNLSDRETEILVSVAKGLSNKEIAHKHNISVNTVISHRKNITRKTGIKTVSGLTVYAMLNNLITQNDI